MCVAEVTRYLPSKRSPTPLIVTWTPATLVAGVQVTIKGVGERFEGKYLVTSATHMYQSGNYKTRFTMTGRQPNTLRYLLGNGKGSTIDRAPADMPGVVAVSYT